MQRYEFLDKECHYTIRKRKEEEKKNVPIDDTQKSYRHVFSCRERLLQLNLRSNCSLPGPTAVAAAFIQLMARPLKLQFLIL